MIGYTVKFSQLKKIKNVNYVQTFLDDGVCFNYKRKNKDKLIKIRQKLKKHKVKIVIHAPFTLNFCRCPTTDSSCKRSLDILIKMMYDAEILEDKCPVVIHMGKKLKLKEEDAFNNYINSLKYILNQTKNCSSIICLETGASVGTEVSSRIEGKYGLGSILDFFKNNDRICVCLDTCHLFSSGYELDENLEILIENRIGWRRVLVCHLNDSCKGLNCHVDRHADLTCGMIGDDLRKFVKICVKRNIPLCLETPGNIITLDKQVEIVKDWIISNK